MDEEEFDPERGTAQADRDVLHAAITGEGLIELKPGDFEALAKAALSTMSHFETQFVDMTKQQAQFVRKLRCEDGYTWRAVAETCAMEWNGDWNSNQIAGMAICERAMDVLNEAVDQGWN